VAAHSKVCSLCRELYKTAEPIKMLFGTLSRVDLWNHVLDWVQMPPPKWALLGCGVRLIKKFCKA